MIPSPLPQKKGLNVEDECHILREVTLSGSFTKKGMQTASNALGINANVS